MIVKVQQCQAFGCSEDRRYTIYCQKHYRRFKKHGSESMLTPYNRLLNKLVKTRDGCLEFTGSRTKEGYGRIKVKGRSILAHRMSWECRHGSVPEGRLILHKCDNPPCCNPNHLYLGEHQNNTDDRVKRGRSVNLKGSDHGLSHLHEFEVLDICDRLDKGDTLQTISTYYKVSRSCIQNISKGRSWNWLTGRKVSC